MSQRDVNLPGNPNGSRSRTTKEAVYVTNGIVHSFDLGADNKLSNQKEGSQLHG